MKFFALIAAAAAIKMNKPSVLTSGEEGIYRLHPYTYTYNDIRDKELKCISDRNREWHYYANNNTWECPLKAYPWAPSAPALRRPGRIMQITMNKWKCKSNNKLTNKAFKPIITKMIEWS